MGASALSKIDEILADFDVIDDWEERYRYLIELGRALDPLPDDARTDANKVRGCASQVWLESRAEGSGAEAHLHFIGDSDAHIVRGLVAVVIAIFTDRTAADILTLDAEPIFSQLSLREHLTPQRSNGVNSMIQRIKSTAGAIASRT